MRLIHKSNNYVDVAEIESRLLAQGIPCKIVEGSLNKVGINMPNGYTLWVYFNEHEDDAINIMNNPDYQSLNGMGDDELEKFMQQIHNESGLSKINSRIIGMSVFIIVILLTLIVVVDNANASDDWIVGKWELSYDPDGRKKDWIEFHTNGDAWSVWQNGERIEGLYIVAPHSIKAVFTYKDQDVIMTFFFDEKKQKLKIVTSASGKESIYTKVK